MGQIPTRLKGWRRHWQSRTHTLDDPVALLSVHRDIECSVNGMIVIDQAVNLPLVDEREAGYDRLELSPEDIEIIHLDNGMADHFMACETVYIYVAREDKTLPQQGLLLQSYLDAVLQGHFNEFGEEGVAHFVSTTRGFDRGVILDRHQPRYPRSVSLSDLEIQLFDEALRLAGVKDFVPLDAISG